MQLCATGFRRLGERGRSWGVAGGRTRSAGWGGGGRSLWGGVGRRARNRIARQEACGEGEGGGAEGGAVGRSRLPAFRELGANRKLRRAGGAARPGGGGILAGRGRRRGMLVGEEAAERGRLL